MDSELIVSVLATEELDHLGRDEAIVFINNYLFGFNVICPLTTQPNIEAVNLDSGAYVLFVPRCNSLLTSLKYALSQKASLLFLDKAQIKNPLWLTIPDNSYSQRCKQLDSVNKETVGAFFRYHKPTYYYLKKCYGRYDKQKDKDFIVSHTYQTVSMRPVYKDRDDVLIRLEKPVSRAIVYVPRQDIGTIAPLKKNSLNHRFARLNKTGRQNWFRFSLKIKYRLSAQGIDVVMCCIPQWEIVKHWHTNRHNYELGVFPHLTRNQVREHEKQILFYMQMYLPDIFTIDPWGWGGRSSKYPLIDVPENRANPVVDKVKQIILSGHTKVKQAADRVENNNLSWDIFIPLQVESDQNILLNTSFNYRDSIKSIIAFSQKAGLRCLVKDHPYSDGTFFCILKNEFRKTDFTEDMHIHSCVKLSSVVFAVNSGVGFEALFLGKAVVSIGRSDYDAATIKLTDLDEDSISTAYQYAGSLSDTELKKRLSRFTSGFFHNYAYLLPSKSHNGAAVLASQKCSLKVYWYRFLIKIMQKMLSFHQRVKRRLKPVLSLWRNGSSKLKSLFIKELGKSVFTNKRIAVIGNGQVGNFAAEIDSADLVIRFNLGHPFALTNGEAPHSQFIDKRSVIPQVIRYAFKAPVKKMDRSYSLNGDFCGFRTDIWVCSSSDKSRYGFFSPFYSCMHLLIHPDFSGISYKDILFSRKLRRSTDTFYGFWSAGKKPSSGLILLKLLAITRCASVRVYGFDGLNSPNVLRGIESKVQAGKTPFHSCEYESHFCQFLTSIDSRFKFVDSSKNEDKQSIKDFEKSEQSSLAEQWI